MDQGQGERDGGLRGDMLAMNLRGGYIALVG